MPRKAKKGSPRYYFTQDTENAIIRHNKEERPYMRERIYNEHIRTAFEKLAENKEKRVKTECIQEREEI